MWSSPGRPFGGQDGSKKRWVKKWTWVTQNHPTPNRSPSDKYSSAKNDLEHLLGRIDGLMTLRTKGMRRLPTSSRSVKKTLVGPQEWQIQISCYQSSTGRRHPGRYLPKIEDHNRGAFQMAWRTRTNDRDYKWIERRMATSQGIH